MINCGRTRSSRRCIHEYQSFLNTCLLLLLIHLLVIVPVFFSFLKIDWNQSALTLHNFIRGNDRVNFANVLCSFNHTVTFHFPLSLLFPFNSIYLLLVYLTNHVTETDSLSHSIHQALSLLTFMCFLFRFLEHGLPLMER